MEQKESNIDPNLKKDFSFQKILFFVGKVFLGIFALYLVLTPFLPSIVFSLTEPEQYEYVDESSLNNLKKAHADLKNFRPIPAENTLVIPKIGVDTKIVEGESAKTLDLGIWRRPKTSTPDKGSNTVLAGHRFMYTSGPNTFYHLDKLEVGDSITVFWEKKRYDYEIIETKVVLPTAVEIEDKTEESILTIYTCTPLFSTEKRLVIVAKLLEKDEKNSEVKSAEIGKKL